MSGPKTREELHAASEALDAAVNIASVNARDVAMRVAINAIDTLPPPPPLRPTEARLALMEIWRPLRYIGSQGPRAFWRECLPRWVPPIDGWTTNPRGLRIPLASAAKVIWADPSPWRTLNGKFAADVLSKPGGFFTLDSFPGVTFCVRRFNAPVGSDWTQARALRTAALSDATPEEVSELDGT